MNALRHELLDCSADISNAIQTMQGLHSLLLQTSAIAEPYVLQLIGRTVAIRQEIEHLANLAKSLSEETP